MKTKTIWIALALFALIPVAGRAQTDVKAMIAAMDTVINHNLRGAGEDPVMKEWLDKKLEKWQDNPEVLTGVAEAYYPAYTVRNTQILVNPGYSRTSGLDSIAMNYIARAIKAKPTYGPAYALAAKISECKADEEAAAEWYSKGMAAAPADTTCYFQYAKTLAYKIQFGALDNLQRADSVLMAGYEHNPAFNAHVHAARICDENCGYFTEQWPIERAVEHYSLADSTRMLYQDYYAEAFHLFILARHDESFAVVNKALDRFGQSDPLLLRLAAYDLLGAKRYPEALDYCQRLFAKLTDAEKEIRDYTTYGEALEHCNRTNEAIAQYQNAINFDTSKRKVSDADRTAQLAQNDDVIKADAIGKIVGIYKNLGEWDKALAECDRYVEASRKNNTLTASKLYLKIEIYEAMLEELNPNEQVEVYKQEEAQYKVLQEEFPEHLSLALYNRLKLVFLHIDTGHTGMGLPLAKQLESYYLALPAPTAQEKGHVLFAYNYMLDYYYNYTPSSGRNFAVWKSNVLAACRKALSIDPDHQTALKLVAQLGKK